MKHIASIVIIAFFTIDTFAQQTRNSFAPEIGKKYIVSGWVKEDHPDQKHTYEDSAIEVVFIDLNDEPILPPPSTSFIFEPQGKIIDGWQRVIGLFEIPDSTELFQIKLVNNNTTIDCYFDDIRVFPYNGNMKTFVYDEDTQRLMAELDENNYATFYEYDLEGGLVRVKKETENGVYTIQETRSGNVKNNN